MKKNKNKENYMVGVVKEGKRVRWPSRETMLSSLVIVIVITVIAALWLLLDDFVVARLLRALEETFNTMG